MMSIVLPPHAAHSVHSRELVVCDTAALAKGCQADVLASTASPVEACLGVGLDSRCVVAGGAVVWMTAAATAEAEDSEALF